MSPRKEKSQGQAAGMQRCAQSTSIQILAFQMSSEQTRFPPKKIDETPTWYRFSAAGVRDADEFFQKNIMLGMVPVTKDHSVFVVIGVHLIELVNDKRATKSIDILSLWITRQNLGHWYKLLTYKGVTVNPVSAPLTGGVDGNDVVECSTRWNTTTCHRDTECGDGSSPRMTYHCVTSRAPSIHDVELKNMP